MNESASSFVDSQPRRASRWLDYARLLRLPNIFTAIADGVVGYLITHDVFLSRAEPALLVVASCGCYLAGMVLNDLWDRDIDAVERPERPIPSGRISSATAARLGWGLLVVGVACGWGTAAIAGNARVGVVISLLATMVVLYDRLLKRTPAGPLAMGICRMLNVLLGMSLLSGPWQPMHWMIADGFGLYIVGVTWLARTEAQVSSRLQLFAASILMMAGLGMLYRFPSMADGVPNSLRPVYAELEPQRWMWLWIIVAMMVGVRCLGAIVAPRPTAVQAAVKRALQALIVMNAIVCFAFWRDGGVMIFLLLAPMWLLGRWVYST